MKLNYKRTILVGMAFFLITAFWQAYDAIIPLILTNHFGLPQSVSGTIMSFDNILAVFMLPLFGALSDKITTRYGKRRLRSHSLRSLAIRLRSGNKRND